MSEITENIFHYTEANRRAWNEFAQVRHTKQPPASFFAQGNSTLDARELQATGEVKGRRLLHLQCATGEDTPSWSVAGAEATGVDESRGANQTGPAESRSGWSLHPFSRREYLCAATGPASRQRASMSTLAEESWCGCQI